MNETAERDAPPLIIPAELKDKDRSSSGKKLLLTSVCRPLGPEFGDSESVGYELLHGQVTRAQGIFSPRCFTHHFSLDYIAHNLDTPTVVLQYPSEKEFVREICAERYDFIGISFILSTMHKMKRMVALIRKHSPHSKIILGGYGAVLEDQDLEPYGDFFCRGEGVEFIRKTLGEAPLPQPFDHPLIINGLKIFSIPVGNNGMIFGGLGCPNGCDFCATSHFFKRKHIKLLPEGDDIFNLIQRYRKEDPNIKFTVLDEDFLLNQKRSRRFLELVRASGQPPPSMFIFASVKALSMYDLKDILEMGVTGVWIGYEGQRSGYDKQKGKDVKQLFRELREAGITILASMVIGFEYQTEHIIQQELSELLTLKPTFTQFLIYGPTPGTPFYKRVLEEDKLLPEYRHDSEGYYKKCTGFYGMVKHPVLSSSELERLQRHCFETDFKVLGPSVVRSVRNWLLGYRTLHQDSSLLLRQRAEMYKTDILNSYPIFLAAKVYAPSREARAEVADLEREIRRIFKVGGMALASKSLAALAMATWTKFCLRMGWFQHPRLTKTIYAGKS